MTYLLVRLPALRDARRQPALRRAHGAGRRRQGHGRGAAADPVAEPVPLKGIQEGEANMLDKTPIIYGSPMGDSNLHNHCTAAGPRSPMRFTMRPTVAKASMSPL